jgi:hypothetical protein
MNPTQQASNLPVPEFGCGTVFDLQPRPNACGSFTTVYKFSSAAGEE